MTGFYAAGTPGGNGAASFDHCSSCGTDQGHGAEGSSSAKEAEAELSQALEQLSDKGQMQGSDQETKALLKDIKEMLSELLQKKEGQDGKPETQDPAEGCGDVMTHDDCGSCGDDVIHGDEGHDHVDGGHGNDEMRGGKGHDHLHGGGGDDQMYGDNGHDRMRGGQGDDEMRGGKGHDRIDGGRDNDRLYGDKGHDVIRGGEGDDQIYGGKGNDRLDGGAGDNRMNGGSGDDSYVIKPGSENVITDGTGNDTVKFDGNRSDYKMERDGDDLVITGKNDDTKVVIKDQYDGKGGVDTLQFDDSKVHADFAGIKYVGIGDLLR